MFVSDTTISSEKNHLINGGLERFVDPDNLPMASPSPSQERFKVRTSKKPLIAGDMKTDTEQTGGGPITRASPPPNAPRAPAASRGRGRGFGRSSYSGLGSGQGRGRGRGTTGFFNQAQSSALDGGRTSMDSRTESPVIGETGLGHHHRIACPSFAASTTGVASDVSNAEYQHSSPAVGIPQGPAWNPPRGPRKYMMYQNQPQSQRNRTYSSSSSMHRGSGRVQFPKERQVIGQNEKQSLKTYSAVVADLNDGLNAKVEASYSPGHVRHESMRYGSVSEGDMAVRSSSRESSNNSWVENEETETADEQVLVPLTQEDADHAPSTVKHRMKTEELPAEELVKFSSSVDRPEWVRTTDEFMVLEFGSAGPITLRRDGTS
ncbi:Tuberous sclerosis 2 [Venturia inaequalis]|nr:Tuberous sclerosis 2 [Venturia inaequalis]